MKQIEEIPQFIFLNEVMPMFCEFCEAYKNKSKMHNDFICLECWAKEEGLYEN